MMNRDTLSKGRNTALSNLGNEHNCIKGMLAVVEPATFAPPRFVTTPNDGDDGND